MVESNWIVAMISGGVLLIPALLMFIMGLPIGFLVHPDKDFGFAVKPGRQVVLAKFGSQYQRLKFDWGGSGCSLYAFEDLPLADHYDTETYNATWNLVPDDYSVSWFYLWPGVNVTTWCRNNGEVNGHSLPTKLRIYREDSDWVSTKSGGYYDDWHSAKWTDGSEAYYQCIATTTEEYRFRWINNDDDNTADFTANWVFSYPYYNVDGQSPMCEDISCTGLDLSTQRQLVFSCPASPGDGRTNTTVTGTLYHAPGYFNVAGIIICSIGGFFVLVGIILFFAIGLFCSI